MMLTVTYLEKVRGSYNLERCRFIFLERSVQAFSWNLPTGIRWDYKAERIVSMRKGQKMYVTIPWFSGGRKGRLEEVGRRKEPGSQEMDAVFSHVLYICNS